MSQKGNNDGTLLPASAGIGSNDPDVAGGMPNPGTPRFGSEHELTGGSPIEQPRMKATNSVPQTDESDFVDPELLKAWKDSGGVVQVGKGGLMGHLKDR